MAHYELFERVGSGATSSVYLGRLSASFGFERIVAIKRLHPQISEDETVANAFVEEARLTARIHHPNVASVLDVVAKAGELSLVMEYVHGASLGALMALANERKEPIPTPVLVGMVCGILRGLHAAHIAVGEDGASLGIVHRDVSPENVIVGADGVARVVDFGIARAASRARRTRTGVVRGKLGYMPPEQLCGEPIDRRADIWAVAVILWEGLVGERLFRGRDDEETVSLSLGGEVVPPSSRGAVSSPALDGVVLTALAEDPRRRFGSALEMLHAVEAAWPPARESEVGAWVEEIAAPVLRIRAEALARIPPRVPAAARHHRRRLVKAAWIASVVAVLAGAAARWGLRAATHDAVAPAEPRPTGSMMAESRDDDVVDAGERAIAVRPAPPAPNAPRSRARSRPPLPASCSPPFSVDAEGHKHFKAECL